MKFKLCFTYVSGFSDELIVEGETIPEIQEIAEKEVEKRNPEYYWSEEIKP